MAEKNTNQKISVSEIAFIGLATTFTLWVVVYVNLIAPGMFEVQQASVYTSYPSGMVSGSTFAQVEISEAARASSHDVNDVTGPLYRVEFASANAAHAPFEGSLVYLMSLAMISLILCGWAFLGVHYLSMEQVRIEKKKQTSVFGDAAY